MAAAGANVIVSARNQEQLDHLVEELNTLGNGSHQTLVMDLEDTKGISSKINPLLDQNPIHILVISTVKSRFKTAKLALGKTRICSD